LTLANGQMSATTVALLYRNKMQQKHAREERFHQRHVGEHLVSQLQAALTSGIRRWNLVSQVEWDVGIPRTNYPQPNSQGCHLHLDSAVSMGRKKCAEKVAASH